jgi:hypothetical protein
MMTFLRSKRTVGKARGGPRRRPILHATKLKGFGRRCTNAGHRDVAAKGWAAFSAEQGIPADEVFVTVAGEDGSFRTARARPVPRPNVKAYFKHPKMGAVGFEAFLDLTAVKETCKLRIFESTSDGQPVLFWSCHR